MLAAPNVLGRPIRRLPGELSAPAGLSGSQNGKRLCVSLRERLQREPLIYPQYMQKWRRSTGCAVFATFIIFRRPSRRAVGVSPAGWRKAESARGRAHDAGFVDAPSKPARSGSSLSPKSDRTRRTGDVAELAPGWEKQCGEECRLRQKCANQLRPIASELICRANSAIVNGLSSFGKSALALSRWEYPVARSNGSPGQTSRINSAKAKPVISGIA